MPASLVVATEVPVRPEDLDDVAAAWSAQIAGGPSGEPPTRLYRAVQHPRLVELVALADLGELAAQERRWRTLGGLFAPQLAGDFRRQVLEFVEAPKPAVKTLPDTPFIELRHVEVRPPEYHAYRVWRDRTIFETVRKAPEVEVFLAYHSVLSTRPGVVFVSGFSCAVSDYLAVFSAPAYQDILGQARERYIVPEGGLDRGLSTVVYRRVV